MEPTRIHYRTHWGSYITRTTTSVQRAAVFLEGYSQAKIEAYAYAGKGEDYRIVGETFEWADGKWTWWCEEEVIL